jgi:amidase
MENGQLIRALAKMTNEPLVPLTEYILSPPVKDHSASESWELQYARDSFKMEYWNSVWVKNDLDVLLCPASHLCAPRPGQIRYWGYTSFTNLVDMPGAVFPVKSFFADAEIDKAYEQSETASLTYSYYDDGRYHKEAKAECEFASGMKSKHKV